MPDVVEELVEPVYLVGGIAHDQAEEPALVQGYRIERQDHSQEQEGVLDPHPLVRPRYNPPEHTALLFRACPQRQSAGESGRPKDTPAHGPCQTPARRGSPPNP